MGLFEIIVFAGIIGLIPAFMAHTKGHNFYLWWAFGWSLWIIAFVCALAIQPTENN